MNKSKRMGGVMIGFGTNGVSVGMTPQIDPNIFRKNANSNLSPIRTKAVGPPPSPVISPEIWLIAKGAEYLVQKLNPHDKSDAKRSDLLRITRPASDVLPVAYAQGAEDTYGFSMEDQVPFCKPIYRFFCGGKKRYPLYSLYNDPTNANYLKGWQPESAIPVGLVYTKEVKDSVAVLVFHGGKAPIYRYARADDAVMITYLTTRLKMKQDGGIQFWMPTKGPFSLIPNGPHLLVAAKKKGQAGIANHIHAFC